MVIKGLFALDDNDDFFCHVWTVLVTMQAISNDLKEFRVVVAKCKRSLIAGKVVQDAVLKRNVQHSNQWNSHNVQFM